MTRVDRTVIIAIVLILAANAVVVSAYALHSHVPRQRALERQKVELCKLARADEDACR